MQSIIRKLKSKIREITIYSIANLALYAQKNKTFKLVAIKLLSHTPKAAMKIRKIHLQNKYDQYNNTENPPERLYSSTHASTCYILCENGANNQFRTPLEKNFFKYKA